MIIRPATRADIAAIMAVERQAATAAHWPKPVYEDLFAPAAQPRVALVAEAQTVLGFLVARTLGPDWELENIAVAADARRQGVATALLRRLLEMAVQSGAEKLWLEVRASSAPARTLYEQCGLRESGLRRGYYNDPVEDAVLYEVAIER